MIVVKTPGGFVDVIGGSATVTFHDGKFQVVCLAGKTIMRPHAGPSIELTAGTMGWVGDGQPTTTRYVFWLLRHPDGEVRVLACESIYRMTGVNAGTGDKYWREDRDPKARERVIKEWWDLVE